MGTEHPNKANPAPIQIQPLNDKVEPVGSEHPNCFDGDSFEKTASRPLCGKKSKSVSTK